VKKKIKIIVYENAITNFTIKYLQTDIANSLERYEMYILPILLQKVYKLM
jgi:hypothetical protein